jgi:predicted PurR-regulated permease PerM
MLAFVAGLGYLTFQILRPFLGSLMWGIVLSIVFYPLYSYTLKYIKLKSLASLIVLVVICAIVVGPFSYFLYLLINEVQDIVTHLGSGKVETLHDILRQPTVISILERISSISHTAYTPEDIETSLIVKVSQLGKELVGKIPVGIGNLLSLLLNFVFMALAVFFMIRDGAGFLEKSRDYMPFSHKQKEMLASEIRDIVISTVYGGTVVAILQGTIGGVTYAALGIRSPVLWGLATSIASFIPLLGAVTVWGPIALYLFFNGFILKGIIMIIIGVFGISIMDFAVKPVLIGNRTSLPVIFIFFSVIGGIGFFGVVGLIMGPLVVALFLSVLEIFRTFEESSVSRG